MQGYMRPFAEAGLQCLLYFAGAGVGDGEGHRTVHADVQLYGVAATDAAGAEVVWVADIREGGDNFQNLFLYLVGQ